MFLSRVIACGKNSNRNNIFRVIELSLSISECLCLSMPLTFIETVLTDTSNVKYFNVTLGETSKMSQILNDILIDAWNSKTFLSQTYHFRFIFHFPGVGKIWHWLLSTIIFFMRQLSTAMEHWHRESGTEREREK